MSGAATRRAVVVGVGNEQRGDDAAGLAVARRVAAMDLPGVEVFTCEGDPSRLLDLWEGAETAVVVDAVSAGGAPGDIHRLGEGARVARRGMPTTSHDLGLEEVLRLAQALGRTPARLVVLGIEGGDFSVGAPMSAAVVAALDRVTAMVVEAATTGRVG